MLAMRRYRPLLTEQDCREHFGEDINILSAVGVIAAHNACVGGTAVGLVPRARVVEITSSMGGGSKEDSGHNGSELGGKLHI